MQLGAQQRVKLAYSNFCLGEGLHMFFFFAPILTSFLTLTLICGRSVALMVPLKQQLETSGRLAAQLKHVL
jgi:hypothetical protein